MVRLTKEQQKILKHIATGTYVYPDAEYNKRSKACQNIESLADKKLIEYEAKPDGRSYYKNFSLTIDGLFELEMCRCEAKKDFRWWVTLFVAVFAALGGWRDEIFGFIHIVMRLFLR